MRAQTLAENLEDAFGDFKIELSDMKASENYNMAAGPRGWVAKVNSNFKFLHRLEHVWKPNWVNVSDICPTPAAAIKSLHQRILFDHPKNSIFKSKGGIIFKQSDGLLVRITDGEYSALADEGLV